MFVRLLAGLFTTLLSPFVGAVEKLDIFSPFDVWYEVYLGEAKVGYAHLLMYQDGDRVKSENEFVMQMSRAGQGIEVSVEQETLEKMNGQLIEFSTTINMAGIPVVKKGWVEGRSLVVYEKQIFTGKRNRYFFDSEAVMSWGLQRKLMEQGFMEAGKTYEIKVYSPDLGMKVPVLTKIVCYGRKEIKPRGKKISAYEVDMEMKSSFGSILTKSWFDPQGIGVQIKMEMGGMNILLVKVPEKKATTMEEEAHEILINSVIPLNKPLSLESEKNAFILETIRGEWKGQLFEGPHQIVEQRNNKSVQVMVFRDQGVTSVKEEIEANSFLEPNLYIDTSDLVIRRLAEKAKGNAASPFEIAEELTFFVRNYITSKNFSVGFATASEVARTRKGDCTEHSVLLAALGRVLGIPSRVATGIVFANHFEGMQNVLVYHMWTQFYLNGMWTNYDSALGHAGCPADRIVFSVSSLEEEKMVESMIQVMRLINNLKVRL